MQTDRRWIRAAGLCSSFAVLGVACLQTSVHASQKKPQVSAATFMGDVKPLIVKYCISCHGGSQPTAGLNLSTFDTPDSVLNDSTIWSKVVDRLTSVQMPPQGLPQPSAAARQRALSWIQIALKNQCRLADPGRVTIRRLNRVEYDNSIRDLTGLNVHPSDDFPSDDVGYGFDDIGDVLSISPLLMEKYLSAAEHVARLIIQAPGAGVKHVELADMADVKGTTQLGDGFREFSTESRATKTVDLPTGGSFRLKTFAYGDLAGTELPKLEVTIDKQKAATFEVGAEKQDPKLYETPVSLDAGKHVIGVAFTNDYYNTHDPVGHQDRNLYVRYLELDGPENVGESTTPIYRHIIPNRPSDPVETVPFARKYIHNFAYRAYRRPVTTEELDRLMKLFQVGFKNGGSFDAGMQIAIEGVLVSPNFLFRVELDPKNNGSKVRPLNDYELASRLSYFLWSTTPDDELLDLAATGKLHRQEVLNAQVKRMLLDPKASALADNFAGQWLQLRKLAIIEPNPKQFPGIDNEMKGYMATETKMFFTSILKENKPISDFIDANYSYINGPLAKIYGISGVTGNNFQKVAMEEPRGGVLTQASVLTVTSNPTRTSPTKRGKWVLEQILGTPPPPPPPGVAQINDEKKLISGATIRKLMEEHRKNPMCAACHAKMDPIGFGFENFDAVGRWRTKDGSFDVDTTGTLPSGQSFKGATDLKKILLKDQPAFARALAEKLLTYGLGRGVESSDKCSIDAIVKKAGENDYRFESLLIAVIDSDPFRKRKGETIK
jgi:hypothetical protein